MNVRTAIFIVAYECFVPVAVFPALLHDFFDFVGTSLLGRESIQQFSLSIYSFSADHDHQIPDSFHAGPHSISWKRLGQNETMETIGIASSIPLIRSSYNELMTSVLIAIFDNSSCLSPPKLVIETEELGAFTKLVFFIPKPPTFLTSIATENSSRKDSIRWPCRYSQSFQEILLVTISGTPFGSGTRNRVHFDVFDLYCIRSTPFVHKISSVGDAMAVEARRSNQHMMPIRFLVQWDPSFQVYQKLEVINHGSLKLISGVMLEEAAFFSHEMNFTIEIVVGTGWTEKLPNGSLSGMGGQLLRDEADVILSICEFRPYRAEKLAFSIVIQQARLRAYFKRSLTVLENLYLMPFQTNLWTAATISFGVLLMVHAAVVTLLRTYSVVSAPAETVGGDWNFTWIISLICQQGWHEIPKAVSLRITFSCGLLLSMILYLLFSSSIVALFSVDVDIFKHMLDLPKYGFKLYALDISELSADILKVTAQDSRMGKYISGRTVDIAEARELVMHTKSAIIAAENQMYQMSRTFPDHSDEEYCSWVSEAYVPGSVWTAGMLFRREDPIRDIFRFKMTAWQERGFRFRNQYMFKLQGNSICPKPPTQIKHLSLSHVELCFQIYVVGAIVAILLFLWEYRRNCRLQPIEMKSHTVN